MDRPDGEYGVDITSGVVTVTRPDANTTNVGQTQSRATVRWASFNTNAAHTVNFTQGNNRSWVTINRVDAAGGETRFLGKMTAPGQVFVINNAGVYFGQGASINVGALIATTSELTDSGLEAQAGEYKFAGAEGAGWARVQNDGTITVAPGGFVLLAAPLAINNGTIRADGAEDGTPGQIELFSGTDFDVNTGARGDGFLTPGETPESWNGAEGELAATNTGTLQSHSGNVYITANMMRDQQLAQTVNLDGVIDVSALASDPKSGGTIMVASATDIKFGNAIIKADGGNEIKASFEAADNIVSREGTAIKIALRATGEPSDQPNGTGDAKAHLYMTAGTDKNQVGDDGGDIDINGTIEVGAEVDNSGLVSDNEGSAYAGTVIAADGDITLNTDVAVNADVSSSGGNPTDSARAEAQLYVNAGTTNPEANPVEGDTYKYDGEGDLIIRGPVSVAANTDTHGAYAWAEASNKLHAGHDIDIIGDIETRTTAKSVDNYENYRWDLGTNPAYAIAMTNLEVAAGQSDNSGVMPEGNIDITGNITTASTAVVQPDTNVSQDSGGSTKAWAETSAKLLAPNDLTVTGDINVIAKADSAQSFWDHDTAHATLAMAAGTNQLPGLGFGPDPLQNPISIPEVPNAGNLTYTGDINVIADADAKAEYGGTATALTLTLMLGGGDVTINTDPVRAKAFADVGVDNAKGGDGGALAAVRMKIATGLAGGQHDLFIRGDISTEAHANHPSAGLFERRPRGRGVGNVPLPFRSTNKEAALADTSLSATGNIKIIGANPVVGADTAPDPAQNRAFVQEQETHYQECNDGTCTDVNPGFAPFNGAKGNTSIAQLMIEAEEGDISITPDLGKLEEEERVPEDVAVQAALEELKPIEPVFPGDLPLRFSPQGDMLSATGVGVTAPPPIWVAQDEEEIARRLRTEDPTKVLPATAAGPGSQTALAEGKDAYTLMGGDFCDQLVSGNCLQGPGTQ